jgi:hypothetical protein
MTSTLLRSCTGVAALAALAWLPSATASSSSASSSADNPVDYSFREAPMNSMGVKGLYDLRGKPIVIEFWGRN